MLNGGGVKHTITDTLDDFVVLVGDIRQLSYGNHRYLSFGDCSAILDRPIA